MLGDILNTVVPGGLQNYAHEKLFAKLGIANYQWQHTPQKAANTADGIQLTPLDFVKFGELYRRGGAWAGQQVIPKTWAEDSAARGGGNKIFVFEEQELVVVVTASAYGRRYMHSQLDDMMTRYILPAVL